MGYCGPGMKRGDPQVASLECVPPKADGVQIVRRCDGGGP